MGDTQGSRAGEGWIEPAAEDKKGGMRQPWGGDIQAPSGRQRCGETAPRYAGHGSGPGSRGWAARARKNEVTGSTGQGIKSVSNEAPRTWKYLGYVGCSVGRKPSRKNMVSQWKRARVAAVTLLEMLGGNHGTILADLNRMATEQSNYKSHSPSSDNDRHQVCLENSVL